MKQVQVVCGASEVSELFQSHFSSVRLLTATSLLTTTLERSLYAERTEMRPSMKQVQVVCGASKLSDLFQSHFSSVRLLTATSLLTTTLERSLYVERKEMRPSMKRLQVVCGASELKYEVSDLFQ